MSDEDDNYDDFMLSDDQGMESIEMEEETDDEDEKMIRLDEQPDQKQEGGQYEQQMQDAAGKVDSEQGICKVLFEQGLNFKEDEQYKEARNSFLKIYYREEFLRDESIDALLIWKFKSLNEIIRLRAPRFHFQSNNSQDLALQVLEDAATMSVFLQRIVSKSMKRYLNHSQTLSRH